MRMEICPLDGFCNTTTAREILVKGSPTGAVFDPLTWSHTKASSLTALFSLVRTFQYEAYGGV